jgi:hypothetical protein
VKYRVFVEDVGPGKFSGAGVPVKLRGGIEAESPREAIDKSKAAWPPGGNTWYGRRLIALPHDRKDLWPNGKTGAVPKEALRFC